MSGKISQSDLEYPQELELLYAQVHPFFKVYEVAYYDGSLYLYGTPRVEISILQKSLWPVFASRGYHMQLTSNLGEDILVATPFAQEDNKFPLTNIILAVITIFTTMFAGATMFGADIFSSPLAIFEGLPFTIAIMAVLGSHEMGHYLMAKRRGMKTTLPYFIPFPTIIGTMGAVIRHKGPIPDRKSLFDVAVAGPLVGLMVSIVVTLIGLMLPAIEYTPKPGTMVIDLQLPILFEFLGRMVGYNGEILHPVAFAGWVGMFVTLLNLLPTGQLDGGHIMRAMLGERAKHISSATPIVLALVALYVAYVMKANASVWIFWSFFLLFFAAAGHPTPLDDSKKLDRGRMAVGVITFILGSLCFTLVPFTLVTL
ncbi:site-2 protease family protein [Methanohalophilus sp.]|uniref:site-2 protease family protein n=1 Tax=Methanohalophilus sp. TaxID=1966352 RepID=UPI0026253FB2|nr:site-2 protease family protein [Methanohalophilus sp.]MDK2892606.1 hypothetical protein [Methanohalophilus sp.]